MRAALRVTGVLLLVVLAAPFVWSLATGDSFMTVTGRSMEPTYHVGDVLVVQRPAGDELHRKGQIVVVSLPASQSGTQRYVHRVVEPTADGAWLQGDNNDSRDPRPVTAADVEGAPRAAISGTAADAFAWGQTWYGRLALVAAASAALLVPVPRRRSRHVATSRRRFRSTVLDGGAA